MVFSVRSVPILGARTPTPFSPYRRFKQQQHTLANHQVIIRDNVSIIEKTIQYEEVHNLRPFLVIIRTTLGSVFAGNTRLIVFGCR